MLSRGELNDDQLRRALEEQKQDGKRIGECLRQMGYANEPQITAALGCQWSCPVLRAMPRPAPDCTIPFYLLRRFCMAPVHSNASTRVLHVAFGGDIEYRALLTIEQILDCKAEACLADASAIQSWLEASEEQGRGADQVFEDVRGPEEITRIASSYATKFCADEARISACGEYIWMRIQGGRDAANLVFRQAKA
jgi:type IV pilus assembly protein PilB